MKKYLLKALMVLFVFGVWTDGFGQDFEWAKSMGTLSEDKGRAIEVDASGNVYTIGVFSDSVDFDPGQNEFYLYPPAGVWGVGQNVNMVFIQKLDANGDFLWAKSIYSTTDAVEAGGITITSNGDILITGQYGGTVDFDPGIDTFFMTSNNSTFTDEGCFILKLYSSGDFLWAKSVNDGHLIGNSITTDLNNNVYVTGTFSASCDFDPGVGIFQETSISNQPSCFILKLDDMGDFVWVKTIEPILTGATYGESTGLSIVVDDSLNIYIAGRFDHIFDFNPGIGSNQSGNSSGSGFILKLDSNGEYGWVSGKGTVIYDIAVDVNHNVYFASKINDYYSNILIGRIRSDGSTYGINNGIYYWEWEHILGSSSVSGEFARSIKLDSYGGLYINAMFGSTINIGGHSISTKGGIDILTLKLDTLGVFQWMKSIGTTGDEFSTSLALDNNGNIYMTGAFMNSPMDFDPTAGVYNLSSNGNNDIFIQKLSQCINTVHNSNVVTCDTFISPSGNQVIYIPGSYVILDTLVKLCGSDSIITLNLTILNATTSTDIQTAPSPFTWIDGNTYTANNNTATETLTNAAGCDSIITLNLTIIDTIIQGKITTSLGNPLQNSKVYLIQYYAATDSVFAMDSTFTDAVGFYQFTNTFQNAYIKAVPNAGVYPNEVPTYNVSSAVFQNANSVYLSVPFSNTDFSTIAGNNPGGVGFIGGIVGNGAGKNSEVGELLPNISLVLMDANNVVVAQTLTDQNGHFEFANLAIESFSLWVDKAGVLNNLAPNISLVADNNLDNLQFILHKTYLENVTSVGIKNITESNFKIFPNPTSQYITVQNTDENEKYSLVLYNILGEQVFSKDIKKQVFSLDLEKLALSKGAYFVKIATEQGSFVSKVVYR